EEGAGIDGRSTRQAAHVDGRVRLGGRAIAELSGAVPSPALGSLRREQRARVVVTGDERGGAGQAAHVDGCARVGDRAVAELTELVASPTLDSARRQPRARVVCTRGDAGDGGESAHV